MVELRFYTACARVRVFHFLVNLVLILRTYEKINKSI